MPSEVQATTNLAIAHGQNRTVFRNPRGDKRYYAFYVSGSDLDYEWSSDGTTWTNTPVEVIPGVNIECFDVKIHDDGSQLEVFVACHLVQIGGQRINYRKGTVGDTDDTITWSAEQIIFSPNDLLADPHSCAIARTDNAELVIAYTQDFNSMGKDYRRTYLIGSDGDGAVPTWSGTTLWDDPSTANNNDLKTEIWFGLETMSGDRVLLYARVPEATDTTNYEVATAVPTWDQGGNDFENTTQNKAISGHHDDDGKVISGVVDDADRGYIIYYEGGSTRLDARKAGSVDDDDWGSASTVKSADVDACTLTLDTGPATDELYTFYHDVADTTDFHYKTTPIDTISWGSEQTITFSSDLIALSSWNRDIENSLHVGIEDADTDVWYHEHALAAPADPIPDRLYKVEQAINRSGTY